MTALLNIFKKKDKDKKAPAAGEVLVDEKPVKKEKKISEAKSASVPPKAEARREKTKKEARGISYDILYSPHITEKASLLEEKNEYTFKVFKRANKATVKKAVEDVYGIDVEAVRIINSKPKQRRLGRITGWTKGYKKAIVKIKEGQKIEIMPR